MKEMLSSGGVTLLTEDQAYEFLVQLRCPYHDSTKNAVFRRKLTKIFDYFSTR